MLARFALHLIRLAACALILLSSSALYAVEPISDPLAQELKQKGDAFMEGGDYDAALDSYERATAIEAHPSLLYNRGRALQALERYTESLSHFEAFREQAPSDLLKLVPQLDGMIAQVSANVATVIIETPEGDREIFVRGEAAVDWSEGEQRFDAGEAVIRIVVFGYEPYQRTFDLKGGETTTLRPKLTALSTTGVLHITSAAAAAEVVVDGKSAGMVPVEITVPAGTHDVTVRHPKFKTSHTTAVVVAGQTKSIAVDLERRPALYQRWWFWAGVGTAAAVGATLAIALTTERSPDKGDIPPGTITVPLEFNLK